MAARTLQDSRLDPQGRPVIGSHTGTRTVVADLATGRSCGLWLFAQSGSLEVLRPGWGRVLTVGAGSTWPGGINPGNGGTVFDGWIWLPVGVHAVTVGAIGTTGGSSSLGSLVGVPGGSLGDSAGFFAKGAGRGLPGAAAGDGYPSDITGAVVAYGAYSGPPGAYGNSHGGDLSADPGVVMVRIDL